MPKGGAKRLLGSVVAVLLGLTLVVASTGLFLPAVPTLTVSLIEPPKLVLPLGPWFRPVARRLELPEIASVPPPPYPLLHRTLPLPPGEQPMIAIVLDDVGLDHARAERATALPGPITLSFMTYAQDSRRRPRRTAMKSCSISRCSRSAGRTRDRTPSRLH
jgi:hypothetical protein